MRSNVYVIALKLLIQYQKNVFEMWIQSSFFFIPHSTRARKVLANNGLRRWSFTYFKRHVQIAKHRNNNLNRALQFHWKQHPLSSKEALRNIQRSRCGGLCKHTTLNQTNESLVSGRHVRAHRSRFFFPTAERTWSYFHKSRAAGNASSFTSVFNQASNAGLEFDSPQGQLLTPVNIYNNPLLHHSKHFCFSRPCIFNQGVATNIIRHLNDFCCRVTVTDHHQNEHEGPTGLGFKYF